jgi:hypothetical protein
VLLLTLFACTIESDDTEAFSQGVANCVARNFGAVRPGRTITRLYSLQILSLKAANDFVPSARNFGRTELFFTVFSFRYESLRHAHSSHLVQQKSLPSAELLKVLGNECNIKLTNYKYNKVEKSLLQLSSECFSFFLFLYECQD